MSGDLLRGGQDRPSHGRTPTRIATIGLAAVFCLIAGFSLLRASSSEKLIELARKSDRLALAYENARTAVADEDFWATESLLRFSPEAKRLDLGDVENEHRDAANDLRRALRAVSRLGRAADRSIAVSVSADHREYLRSVDRLFAAIDARKPERAFAIEVEQIDPLFPSMASKVQKASRNNRRKAERAFAEIERSNETTIAAMAVVIPIGFVLLLLLAGLLHASRRREQRARADVTRLELERLHHLALSDSLTSLMNHRAFHQDLARDLQRRQRAGSSLALAILDIDGLKATNDTFGHEAGDAKLRDLADSLLQALRTSDAAYRIGGDEFALILSGSDGLGALLLIGRLQESLTTSASGARATAGVAEANDGMTKDELIREADLALIEAKRKRLPAVLYSDNLDPRVVEAEREGGGEHARRSIVPFNG